MEGRQINLRKQLHFWFSQQIKNKRAGKIDGEASETDDGRLSTNNPMREYVFDNNVFIHSSGLRRPEAERDQFGLDQHAQF